jgi:crotonobetainyl-CoA:carnitine CoA-transferase CaiB-like acyl-CoA transferase
MAEIPDPSTGALDGVRVLEFAQALAIPSCGALLSDMGADVVKIEPPRGDTYRLQRATKVRHEGRDFAICNRGKRSLCLDLTKPESRAVVDRLVKDADIVLVSFKPTDLERYGLDYERLRELQPRLVYLENTPYGRAGPLGDDGGYDVVAMGLSGLSAVVASASGDTPRFVRPAFADIVTGMVSALAVVTALRHRDRTGVGQRVHTSLLHTALGMISNMIYRYEELDGDHQDAFAETLRAMREEGAGFAEQQNALATHFDMWPVGNVYFRHYRTRDGFLSVGCLSPRLNERFREATELVDPRRSKLFEPGSAEEAAAIEIFRDEAEALFATRDTDDWLETLRAHGVPAARLNFPHEIFDDPQAQANGYVTTLTHPHHGAYQVVTSPLQMEATPIRARGPSPSLGAHTEEVLEELGFDAKTRAELHESGIVGARKRSV